MATTLDEYRKYIEKNPALERRSQQVYIYKPYVENTISIFQRLCQQYELHHAVRISNSVVVEATGLSNRYMSGKFLPGLLGEHMADQREPFVVVVVECRFLAICVGFVSMSMIMAGAGEGTGGGGAGAGVTEASVAGIGGGAGGGKKGGFTCLARSF